MKLKKFSIGGVSKIFNSSKASRRIIEMGENSPEFFKFFGFKQLDDAVNAVEKSGEVVPQAAKYLQKKAAPQQLAGTGLYLSGTTKKCSKDTIKQLDTLAAQGDQRCLVLSEILQDEQVKLPAEFVSYVESIFKFGHTSKRRNKRTPFKLSAEEQQEYAKLRPSKETVPFPEIETEQIYYNGKYHERPTDLKPNKKENYTVYEDTYQEVKSFKTRKPKSQQELLQVDKDLDYAVGKLQEIVKGTFTYTDKMQNSIMLKSTGKNISYTGLKQMDSIARKNFGRLEQPRILTDLMNYGHIPTTGTATVYDAVTDEAVKSLRAIRDKWIHTLGCSPEDLEIRPILAKKKSTYIPIVDNRSTETWGQLSSIPQSKVSLSHKITRPSFVSDYGIFIKGAKKPLEIIPRKELHHALTPLAEAEMYAIAADPTNRNGIKMIQAIQRNNKGFTAEEVRNYYRSHQLLDQATHIAAHNEMILSKTDLGRIKNLAASGRFKNGNELLKYYLGMKSQQNKFFAKNGIKLIKKASFGTIFSTPSNKLIKKFFNTKERFEIAVKAAEESVINKVAKSTGYSKEELLRNFTEKDIYDEARIYTTEDFFEYAKNFLPKKEKVNSNYHDATVLNPKLKEVGVSDIFPEKINLDFGELGEVSKRHVDAPFATPATTQTRYSATSWNSKESAPTDHQFKLNRKTEHFGSQEAFKFLNDPEIEEFKQQILIPTAKNLEIEDAQVAFLNKANASTGVVEKALADRSQANYSTFDDGFARINASNSYDKKKNGSIKELLVHENLGHGLEGFLGQNYIKEFAKLPGLQGKDIMKHPNEIRATLMEAKFFLWKEAKRISGKAQITPEELNAFISKVSEKDLKQLFELINHQGLQKSGNGTDIARAINQSNISDYRKKIGMMLGITAPIGIGSVVLLNNNLE